MEWCSGGHRIILRRGGFGAVLLFQHDWVSWPAHEAPPGTPMLVEHPIESSAQLGDLSERIPACYCSSHQLRSLGLGG